MREDDLEEAEPADFDNVEKRVQEVMTQVMSGEVDIGVEERQIDIDNRTAVTTVVEKRVGVRKGRGANLAPLSFLRGARESYFSLSCSELDLVVMGQLMAGMNDNPSTDTVTHKARTRQRVSCNFQHQGNPICDKMFRFFTLLVKPGTKT